MMTPDPVPGHPTTGMNIWGWMTPTELEWLKAQAAHMRSVVEVGCLHGRSSAALAAGCPGNVYCIDPWSDLGYASWTKSIGDVYPNTTAIRSTSPAAGTQVPDPVDMVFLDGAHDHASVTADINYWRPRTNVLLCGHDYLHPGYPDVATVVDALLGPDIEIAPNTSIWTYRP